MADHERGSDLLGGHDPGRSHGAALGAGGVEGWWVWRNRRRLRGATDAVSPGTWRGALHVTLWFAGLLVTGLAAVTVLPGWAAFVVAFVVMLAVGRWWDRRSERRA